MRCFPFAFVLLAMLGLAACLPVSSKTPVGATVGFKADPALFGTWKARDPDGSNAPAYIHFLGDDDGTMTAILVEPPQKENMGEYSVYRLRVATLGANHIINALEVTNNGKPIERLPTQENMLFLYRADRKNKLTLYQMDDKAAAALIKSGVLAGEVEPGQDGDVRITADAASLDAFMRTPRAGALFNKPLVTMVKVY